MKIDPSRPIYEPRNARVRRELFRFADLNHIKLSGQHHPVRPHADFGLSTTDEHWTWLFTAQWIEDRNHQIPVSDLLALLYELYPGKPIHMHIPEGELGIDALYVLVPVVTQRREG
jgi:hypothetical protein